MLFTESLKKNFQFRYVYQKGKSIANRQLILYVLKNRTNTNKLGISVSKKVGKSVVRSHVTRLIRESYRLIEPDLERGYTFIIVARPITKDASFHQILASFKHLLRKHPSLQNPTIEPQENTGKNEKLEKKPC